MTFTARKYAWLNRISPKVRHITGLYILEISAIMSWTLLSDTLFARVSGGWFILLPVGYLLAVAMLAWLEQSGYGNGMFSPLKAMGLDEISLQGRKPTQWQTLRRLFFTPPLTLLLGIGFIPVPGKKANLLQLISGTRIVPLDIFMDPRSRGEIQESRQRALMRVIAYTLTSLMVSAIIVLVPPGGTDGSEGDYGYSVHSLPDEERELLAAYLDLAAIYPDSIEFHVRLASLYYRNDMFEDLANELAHVRRLDRDHAILLLEEDLSVSIADLQIQADSGLGDSIRIIMHQPYAAVSDTIGPTASDTVETGSEISRDTISLDLRLVSSDSIAQEPDMEPDEGIYTDRDTLPEIPDDPETEEEADPASTEPEPDEPALGQDSTTVQTYPDSTSADDSPVDDNVIPPVNPDSPDETAPEVVPESDPATELDSDEVDVIPPVPLEDEPVSDSPAIEGE